MENIRNKFHKLVRLEFMKSPTKNSENGFYFVIALKTELEQGARKRIKFWRGNIDKGEGDVCSNFPMFFDVFNVHYKDIEEFTKWFKIFLPKCKIVFKNRFANIYWDKSVLIEVLKSI